MADGYDRDYVILGLDRSNFYNCRCSSLKLKRTSRNKADVARAGWPSRSTFLQKNGEPEPEVGAPKLSAITIHHTETREQVQRVWAEGSCRGG